MASLMRNGLRKQVFGVTKMTSRMAVQARHLSDLNGAVVELSNYLEQRISLKSEEFAKVWAFFYCICSPSSPHFDDLLVYHNF
jgi:hypothetical protein